MAITRGKEDARVYTDNVDNLCEQVKSLQVKQTALDYAGEIKAVVSRAQERRQTEGELEDKDSESMPGKAKYLAAHFIHFSIKCLRIYHNALNL